MIRLLFARDMSKESLSKCDNRDLLVASIHLYHLTKKLVYKFSKRLSRWLPQVE